VYLEYKGVRFLFTGDNSSQKEQKLINDYKSGAIERFLFNKEVTVNLESIDFLKVAHHGSDDSTCADFLALTRPKNAIISVGGNNIYGHPSTSTLVKLEVANENVNVLRTDVKGTISVMVNKQGIVNVQTSS
jgi:competence protein ComEC